MAANARTTPHLLDAAYALQSLRATSRRRVFALRRGTRGDLLGVADTGSARLFSGLPLGALIEAMTESATTLTEVQLGADHLRGMCANLADESLDRLCWLFGERLAREVGLAPWLDRRAAYRLLCWPDFGEIGRDGDGLALCTLLAGQSLSLPQVAASLRLPPPIVAGLFNALALCGTLTAEDVQPRQWRRGRLRHTVDGAAEHGLFERLLDRLGARWTS